CNMHQQRIRVVYTMLRINTASAGRIMLEIDPWQLPLLFREDLVLILTVIFLRLEQDQIKHLILYGSCGYFMYIGSERKCFSPSGILRFSALFIGYNQIVIALREIEQITSMHMPCKYFYVVLLLHHQTVLFFIIQF